MKVLSDLDVFGKRVFMRADLDVPTQEGKTRGVERGNGSGEFEAIRLTNLKPTIDYLLEHGAKQIIIAGHIDRPTPRLRNGKPVIDPALSTEKLLEPLEKILGKKVAFSQDVMRERKLTLLENLRFWSGETANDPTFAKQLASLADIYVNEAFGNCHREHASMVALSQILPHAAGLHLEREISELSRIMRSPQKPLVAIVGGAKLETKVPVIENLAKVADFVLVGGELPVKIKENGLNLPSNVNVASLIRNGLDTDDESIHQFEDLIAKAQTVVWNGPMGVFEKGHEAGTMAVAAAIIKSGAYSLIGGGETTQFLASKNLLSQFSFVSSGGGAMLEFLAGKQLPALKALE